MTHGEITPAEAAALIAERDTNGWSADEVAALLRRMSPDDVYALLDLGAILAETSRRVLAGQNPEQALRDSADERAEP